MIGGISPLLLEAVRYSQTLSLRVDIHQGRTMTTPRAPVVGGTVVADRGNKDRLSADVTMALNDWEQDIVNTRNCQLHISLGLETLGMQDRLSLGWFRVDEVDRAMPGEVSISTSGREAYVYDARLLRPRTPSYGQSTVNEIITLIREVVPSAKIRVRNTRDQLIEVTTPWDRDRWGAIEALAKTIDAEVFCDHSGEFVIADVPSIATGVPVYRINEGDLGVMISRTESDTREQVYNAVSVTGTSSDPNVPPLWGWAYDDDPASPTYYFADPLEGGFGQVPRFYTSGWFTADWQCVRTAKKFLIDALAENRKLSFATVPLPFLEVNDLVDVDMLDGTREIHLIDRISFPLNGDGGMQCDTRSTKVEARETD
jgi:hypothetical protein